MNILERIWEAIKSLAKAFKRQVPAHIQEYIEQALQITTRIKNVLNGDGVALVTAIIPGDFDNKLVEKIKSILQVAIPELVDVKGCGTDLQCYLNELLKFIQEQAPKTRKSLLMSLAQLIVAGLDDNKLKESTYDTYAQWGMSAQKHVA